jgi:sulfur-oxidizing protein SoxB
MVALIEQYRTPFANLETVTYATCNQPLYRRGNFTGPMDQMICNALRRHLDAQIALSPGFRWGTTIIAGQPITGEGVMAATAITYPETYVQDLTGSALKAIMEDVADNLFNPDPYYQQGGDMVRGGGMDYACAPEQSVGNRISDMTLDDGSPIEADKSYRVAGWASVNSQNGNPIPAVVAAYLRDNTNLTIERLNRVTLKGVADNPGIIQGDPK